MGFPIPQPAAVEDPRTSDYRFPEGCPWCGAGVWEDHSVGEAIPYVSYRCASRTRTRVLPSMWVPGSSRSAARRFKRFRSKNAGRCQVIPYSTASVCADLCTEKGLNLLTVLTTPGTEPFVDELLARPRRVQAPALTPPRSPA